MENHGIKYYSFARADDIIRFGQPAHRKLKHRALIIREKIIGMYKERGITGDRLALVAAITLGQKNMLDPEQKQIFVKAGIMHIMAVSGLHAVIMSLFVFNLLFFMKRRLNFLKYYHHSIIMGLCICDRTDTLCLKSYINVFFSSRPVKHEKGCEQHLNSVLASA